MAAFSGVPLSVLDLAPVSDGSDAATALRNTVDLAQHVESLGYHRYWLAEHHNMPGIASSATVVLINQVANATETLRVGSGGIMLPNHAPLVVAEQFGTLEAFHPGRIDLGLGRAPGTDPRTAAAVRGNSSLTAADFPHQLTELISYFEHDDARGVNAVTAEGNQPPVWLLGSSDYSARLAGMLGLPFSFAHHFAAANTLPALAAYRDNFRPSAVLDKPHAMVAVSVICADTDEQAQYLAGPGLFAFLSLRRGKPIPLPTPEFAANYPYDEQEQRFMSNRRKGSVVGSPDTVRRELSQLAEDTQADELMVTTMVHAHDDRRRSYELLAKLAQ
ncbi:MAG: MsnO8 family LLM class oxidoreductase [Actinophytocola sp.]|nr:MsnO8 family LLM class oxidoreductase [Actinophytocola sp.]